MLHNIKMFREHPLVEMAGALGDLGTLLPIMIALSSRHAISLSSTLIFSGCYNIVTGAVFGIPLPVQPMKAIASIALSRSIDPQQVMGAGIGTSAVVLLLSVTGLLHWAARVVPFPVVKGIQVGAGLSLILNAGVQVQGTLSEFDTWILAILAFVALYATSRTPRFPIALALFFCGLLVSLAQTGLHGGREKFPRLGLNFPRLTVPSFSNIERGFLSAGVGQIPLTVLNSVIAVTSLSRELLPSQPAPSVTSLGISVGMMNLVGCWFGAMPVCHGSGGLAAQYRFGARSGASIIFLGLCKLVLGVLFGNSLEFIMNNFPHSVLGVMVFAAGMELIGVGRDLNATPAAVAVDSTQETERVTEDAPEMLTGQAKKDRWVVMMATAGTLLAFHDAMVGMLVGCGITAILAATDHFEERRRGRIQI